MPLNRAPVIIATVGEHSHVAVMNLELTDEEAAALLKELDGIIDGDRAISSRHVSRP